MSLQLCRVWLHPNHVLCCNAASAWSLRSAPKGFAEAPSLATRTTCAKVRCMHSDTADESRESSSGLKTEHRFRSEAPPSNGLDDSKFTTCRTSRRRDFVNLAIGLGSALLVGRWAEKGTAIAVTKKDTRSPYDEKKLLDQNRRMQKVNNAPEDFPNFIREGFEVKVVTDEKYTTAQSGLIYYDLVEGQGELPKDGQQVKFHYIGYNENGRRIDSSYQQGEPARTRLGIKGMIPGFEEGIRTMKPGGKRRIVIPPELGPPVGPSTFFSAKQFEVFDVELLEVKDCVRRTVFLYSDVVCD
ncbi:hypothetical protein KC19_1G117400 [Ceratodon purpureus]|uniref:peptidylprolyl isomerase n=1 Tax=Ceratodon purpureus TaxID=3225 RepID=A0A8T0J555_CERPU|nr:hypothetical protein KC19_1G117400 [Ceratodon purpureus]